MTAAISSTQSYPFENEIDLWLSIEKYRKMSFFIEALNRKEGTFRSPVTYQVHEYSSDERIKRTSDQANVLYSCIKSMDACNHDLEKDNVCTELLTHDENALLDVIKRNISGFKHGVPSKTNQLFRSTKKQFRPPFLIYPLGENVLSKIRYLTHAYDATDLSAELTASTFTKSREDFIRAIYLLKIAVLQLKKDEYIPSKANSRSILRLQKVVGDLMEDITSHFEFLEYGTDRIKENCNIIECFTTFASLCPDAVLVLETLDFMVYLNSKFSATRFTVSRNSNPTHIFLVCMCVNYLTARITSLDSKEIVNFLYLCRRLSRELYTSGKPLCETHGSDTRDALSLKRLADITKANIELSLNWLHLKLLESGTMTEGNESGNCALVAESFSGQELTLLLLALNSFPTAMSLVPLLLYLWKRLSKTWESFSLKHEGKAYAECKPVLDSKSVLNFPLPGTLIQVIKLSISESRRDIHLSDDTNTSFRDMQFQVLHITQLFREYFSVYEITTILHLCAMLLENAQHSPTTKENINTIRLTASAFSESLLGNWCSNLREQNNELRIKFNIIAASEMDSSTTQNMHSDMLVQLFSALMMLQSSSHECLAITSLSSILHKEISKLIDIFETEHLYVVLRSLVLRKKYLAKASTSCDPYVEESMKMCTRRLEVLSSSIKENTTERVRFIKLIRQVVA